MKRWLCIGLTILLVSTGALALAQETGTPQPAANTTTNGQLGSRWAKGTVQAVESMDIFAPIGGQVLAFAWEEGDIVAAGDSLFSLRPQKVTAPYDGVIRIQLAQVGDVASDVISEYGSLLVLDRTDVLWAWANTKTAHDKWENRDIVVGEELRVYNGKSNDSKEAVGRVVRVDGDDFLVEFPAGTFNPEDNAHLYRGTGSDYKDKDLVGKGTVKRVPPISIQAEGKVANIAVTEGATVTRGDTLYLMDARTAEHTQPASAEVTAPVSGMISSLRVLPGQEAVQQQLLLTVDPLDTLECVVDADELDVGKLTVGQTLQVRVDTYPDALYTATVTEISPLGNTVLDTTKYPVTLSFPAMPEGLMPGMHVTAYWD